MSLRVQYNRTGYTFRTNVGYVNSTQNVMSFVIVCWSPDYFALVASTPTVGSTSLHMQRVLGGFSEVMRPGSEAEHFHLLHLYCRAIPPRSNLPFLYLDLVWLA